MKERKKAAGKAECKYCRKPILWQKIGEKWKPLNPDGSKHDCYGKKKRREWWLKKHAQMLKDQRILNAQYKAALDRSE